MILTRVATGNKGTFGVIVDNGLPLCVTCEDPWNDNITGNSCIPEGTYDCVPHNGARYQNVWRLEDVPGREAILIHSGNSIADTQGCILVGESFIGDRITNSRETLNMLRKKLPERFSLTIRSIK